MKIIFLPLLFLSLLISFPGFSQIADSAKRIWWYPDTTGWSFKMETSADKWNRLSLETPEFQLFSRIPSNAHAANHSHSSGSIGYYGKGHLYWLNGLGEIELAAAGVSEENKQDFLYHLVENDSVEIVPWTNPSSFRTNNKLTYAYLGRIKTSNRIIRLEFYHKGRYAGKQTWVFNDLYLPSPTVRSVRLTYNNRFLFKPFEQQNVPHNKQQYYKPEDWAKGGVSFPWSDSISHLEVNMRQTVQNDMYNVYLKRIIGEKTDTVYISSNWNLSYYSPDPFLIINSSYFNKPGRYEILVLPQAPQEFGIDTWGKAVAIPFTVRPSASKSFTGLQLALWTSAVFLGCSILFLIYFVLSRRRLAAEAREKEVAALRLQSVRAQLNPHFMFNALTGIQNLINRNDIEGANRYLVNFSRLTRRVLDDSKKDLVNIAEERSMLNTYLEMEQMRFGFKYDIFVEGNIDQENTDIPAMLIQPYVENAVRHGVSSLNGQGRISVSIRQEADGLRVDVQDNGKGFMEHAGSRGNGTRLSDERMDLLNRLHRNAHISLERKSDQNGTFISLYLKGYTDAFHNH